MENEIKNTVIPTENSSLIAQNKIASQMHFGHLGKIFSNISIACLLISLAGVLSFVLYAIVTLLGACVLVLMVFGIIVTLGIILLIIPGYWNAIKTLGSWMGSLGDLIEKVGGIITKIWPVVVPLAITTAVASLLCLIFDKTEKHTTRIVISSIVVVIAIIVLIVFIAGGAV